MGGDSSHGQRALCLARGEMSTEARVLQIQGSSKVEAHSSVFFQVTLESCHYTDKRGLRTLLWHPLETFRFVNTTLSRSFMEAAR